MCVPLCSLSGEGAPLSPCSLSILDSSSQCCAVLCGALGALPLSVCVCSPLSLLAIVVECAGGGLLSTCLLRSLAFFAFFSHLLSCVPCRFGTLSLCFLHSLSYRFAFLSSYSRFLSLYLLSCSLFVLSSASISLCTLWASTFRCSESFAVVRSHSHSSGTRSLNLSRLLVPHLLVRFSLSY